MAAEFLGLFGRTDNATALIDEAGEEITYAQLSRRCAEFARTLGQSRQLILLHASNDIDSVVAYLASMSAGHVVILSGDAEDGSSNSILQTFSPGIVCRGGRVTRIDDAPPADLHPELAVVLPTSGSMGNPKLVRLSHRNLDSNAEAIVDYLGITAQDRAISSLPFCYSYGLSVLNTHLRAGASVVLTNRSVTDPAFWDLFRRKRATSIAGVPHSYELFERIGLRDNPPESLRVMTQAGGRLSPDLIRTYSAFGADKGVRFFAMYGQTEASPRMAYLPPDLATRNPDCIGRPIPGGSFSLVDELGLEITRPEARGELVYRGPNVMMGYASSREDLSRGSEVESLRTGDLAVRTKGGLFRIVGRASRFVKIAGLRIGLDDLETGLAEVGRKAYVAGSDQGLSICLIGEGAADEIRDLVARRCRLPVASVHAHVAAAPPTLSSGKIDYAAIQAVGVAQAAATPPDHGSVAAAYASALGIGPPAAGATFASLGGDSLSYVNAAIGIERALGYLPKGWENMPIASLQAMRPASDAPTATARWMESEIPVRVVALLLVMAGHSVFAYERYLQGGANVLFALAGFSLARFQGRALLRGDVGTPILSFAYRVFLPYAALILVTMLVSPAHRSAGWLLMFSLLSASGDDPLMPYWFVQSLFHALALTCALFLIPAFRRLTARRPFAVPVALVALAAVLMQGAPHLWSDGRDTHFTVDAWLYAYFLGWAAYTAPRDWQKALVVLLAMALSGLQYGFLNSREILFTLGLAVVLFAPRIKLPKRVGEAVLVLAAANYFIYLAHPFVLHALNRNPAPIHSSILRIGFVVAGSVIAGLVYAWGWEKVVRHLRERLSRLAGGFRSARIRTA